MIRELFLEYAGSLGFSLCFQGFEQEVATLPGRYSPPGGALYVALLDGVACGCVGIRKLEDGVCEMKRLYVRPAGRGRGMGRRLAETAIHWAREAGYQEMKLDTLPSMQTAIALYRSLGFVETAPYTENPIAGAKFLSLPLAN